MDNVVKNILLVEDDENDVFFIRHSLKGLGYRGALNVCANGEEAIDYIFGCGEFADRARFPFPQLIVTDWQMPRAGGKEVLNWLRDHPSYMVVPVIVLTSSGQAQDVKDAYCAGATAYLVKPSSQEKLGEIFRDFLQFWGHVLKPQLDVHAPCEEAKEAAAVHH
jgi:CheY-like chemotaxis protein